MFEIKSASLIIFRLEKKGILLALNEHFLYFKTTLHSLTHPVVVYGALPDRSQVGLWVLDQDTWGVRRKDMEMSELFSSERRLCRNAKSERRVSLNNFISNQIWVEAI